MATGDALYGHLTRTTIDICADCVTFLAYGEGHENVPAGHADLVAGQWGSTPIELGCPGDCCGEEGESWFSWTRCEGCGSNLGGDREHATVFERD